MFIPAAKLLKNMYTVQFQPRAKSFMVQCHQQLSAFLSCFAFAHDLQQLKLQRFKTWIANAAIKTGCFMVVVIWQRSAKKAPV